jgi:hypothetical protein
MQANGNVKSIQRDFVTNKTIITMMLDNVSPAVLQSFSSEEKYQITIVKPRKKRSNDANSYFHVLVGKIADALRISKPHCKNMLLGRYGQREMQDGKPIIISVYSTVDMMEREDIHTIAIGYGTVNGKEFTHYAVIRGSHTYNTKEMSILIDGTVDEAKGLGIETIPPDELKLMLSKWNTGKEKQDDTISSS